MCDHYTYVSYSSKSQCNCVRHPGNV